MVSGLRIAYIVLQVVTPIAAVFAFMAQGLLSGVLPILFLLASCMSAVHMMLIYSIHFDELPQKAHTIARMIAALLIPGVLAFVFSSFTASFLFTAIEFSLLAIAMHVFTVWKYQQQPLLYELVLILGSIAATVAWVVLYVVTPALHVSQLQLLLLFLTLLTAIVSQFRGRLAIDK